MTTDRQKKNRPAEWRAYFLLLTYLLPEGLRALVVWTAALDERPALAELRAVAWVVIVVQAIFEEAGPGGKAVIEECAAFPYGENDDYVDSMTQAVMRFRQGNFVRLYSDEEDEESVPKRHVYY